MIKLITFIAFLYLLIELLSRTEEGPDGKVRFQKLPRWIGLIKGIFSTPAKSSVIEVDVKEVAEPDI